MATNVETTGSWRRRRSRSGSAAVRQALGPHARIYLALVVVGATALSSIYLSRLRADADASAHQWVIFAAVSALAAIAQLFPVTTPANQAYHTTIVFLVAGTLLLPPELLPLVALVQHIPEWLKERIPWYIQLFNIGNYVLDLLAGLAAFRAMLRTHDVFPDHDARFVAAGIVAAGVIVAVNHVLLAVMLRLGRGHSWRQSGLFTFESLSTDFGLATVGITIAAAVHTNPWLLTIALVPVALIHKALSVPTLEAAARLDAKTQLYNARYFSHVLQNELERAKRFQRPLALLMIDLDLLREINNVYGHLSGDAVLAGVADIFRATVREQDVAARFGGEEFSIILPETDREAAMIIAERIRVAVTNARFIGTNAPKPIEATVSIGVAAYPEDADDCETLIHHADLAVYGAKKRGRNCVVAFSPELSVAGATPRPEWVSSGMQSTAVDRRQVRSKTPTTQQDRRRKRPPTRVLVDLSPTALPRLAAAAGIIGSAAGLAALLTTAHTNQIVGLSALALLAATAQLLALEAPAGSLSVAAVAALAAAGLFGIAAALPVALATAASDWVLHRPRLYKLLFNCGTLTVATLAAAGFDAAAHAVPLPYILTGIGAGAAYYTVNTGLLALALASEVGHGYLHLWRQRLGWLLPHYLAYGAISGITVVAFHKIGPAAIVALAVPLLLIRKTQEAYLANTRSSAVELDEATRTIREQNQSLERANQLLRQRSTAAMTSLVASVEARDPYTAGHSRRVREIALALGRELRLSEEELETLGHAALFHDIGKLAVPEAILLNPGPIGPVERNVVERHPEHGAQIIEQLGFLQDAVLLIRHHHERWDGAGYPNRLSGTAIPLGARIIHVADAFDAITTSRVYRSSSATQDAVAEIARHAGTQFCPTSAAALEQALRTEAIAGRLESLRPRATDPAQTAAEPQPAALAG